MMLGEKSLGMLAAATVGVLILTGCGANNRVVTSTGATVEKAIAVTSPSAFVALRADTVVQQDLSEPPTPDLREINVYVAVQDGVRDGTDGRRFSGLISKCSGVQRPGPADVPASENRRSVENVLFLNRNRIAVRGYHMLTDVPTVPGGDVGGAPGAEDQRVMRCADALVTALASVNEPDYNPAAAANIEIVTAASTTNDLAVQRAAWTRCMGTAAFAVRVRSDSITEFLKSAEPTEAERAQALADYECQGSSSLREGKRQWLASQATAWLAKNKAWVDSLASSRVAYESKLAELEQKGWRG